MHTDPAAPFARPTVAPRDFLIWSAIAHAVSFVLRTSYLWLDDLVRAKSGTLGPRIIEEGSSAVGAYLLSWFVFVAWRAAPLRSPHFLTRFPGYLAFGLLISVAHTSFMWLSRALLFPLFDLGAYDYGRMPLRYLMEAPGALLGFATMLGALALADEIIYRRREETTRLELERGLAQSQLRSLRLQLQPHFLFNALNTISAQLHENPALADRLIGRLADLLRVSLRTTDELAAPLREELALLECYADLMRARFGARLHLSIHAPEQVLDVRVPPLLPQPLVENAVRHGVEPALDGGSIRIEAVARLGQAVLTVHNTVGEEPSVPGNGMALLNVRERLRLLHDVGGQCDTWQDEQGFHARITVPLT